MDIRIEPRKVIFTGIIAAAAVFVVTALWTEETFRRLENDVGSAKKTAAASQQRAEAIELKAAGYTEKIVYLEGRIRAAEEMKRRQNEKINKQNDVVNGARGRVERARRTRAIDAGTDELCEKLSKLGHGC